MSNTLESWTTRRNRLDADPLSMTDATLTEAIKDMENTLQMHDPSEAPENFYCDGEISHTQAVRRWRGWQARLKALNAEQARRKRV